MMDFPTPDPVRGALYRQQGYWRDETIVGLIAVATARTPEKIAVRDASGMALSYGELARRSAAVAGFLAEQGVGKGNVVTICLPNWCDTVTAFLATLRLGAIVNPVPVTYGRADLAHVLTMCDSRALLVPNRFRSTDFQVMLDGMAPQLLKGRAVIVMGGVPASGRFEWEEALAAQPIRADAPVKADDPAAVLFTSGTEARAKGAVHTHNTILFGERALGVALGVGAEDVAFMASPISHTTGFMHGFVMTLTTGGTLSLLDVFSGDAAARQMAAHRATWTMGATPFLGDISAEMEAAKLSLPDLRYFLCGGAPIPEVLARQASDLGLRVLSIYGSTESPPHTMVLPQDPVENAWLTDGRPFPGIEVRIVGEGGCDTTGEIGEEWSRGPNTFLGYLGEPELTARDLDTDGWYHSGDLGRLLPDGSVRITGRLKEIIIRGGQNISVREVEDYLAAHPAIARAAVVGIAHPRLGETGCAVIVPREGMSLTLADLTAFLAEKGVARFKLPERLELWQDLPMSPSGKIQKFIIRQRLAEQDEKGSS